MYRLEDHEIVSLLGQRVRIRKGAHAFEGTLIGPSEKQFERGPFSKSYGVVLEGADYRLDFAWWDWNIQPLCRTATLMAAE